MADEKVVSNVLGYKAGRYQLSAEDRAELARKWPTLRFNEEDFNDMERALDTSHALFDDLQLAPTPALLDGRLDDIILAARRLWAVLHPTMLKGPPSGRLRAPRDYSAAIEAAERVRGMLFMRVVEYDTDGQPLVDTDLQKLKEFEAALWRLATVAQESKETIRESVVSERGTLHLKNLRDGLVGIAERQKQPTRFTTNPVDDSRSSFVCTLAFELANRLPEAMRPASEKALIEQMARDPKPPP